MDSKRLKLNILDRPISRGKSEVWSALELRDDVATMYFQGRVQNISDLERKLEELGHSVGIKMLELLCHRDKADKREVRLINMLQFIVSTCWKSLFGRQADALERSTENTDEYMIHELYALTNRFISVPSDLGQLNCAAYIAGIIRGILDSGGFPARVTAHTVETGEGQTHKTVFLVKFYDAVMKREGLIP